MVTILQISLTVITQHWFVTRADFILGTLEDLQCLSNESNASRMIELASSTCSSEMLRGGASLMMSPCVGFARRPLSLSARHTSHAVTPSWGLMTRATNSPLPRTCTEHLICISCHCQLAAALI